MRKVALGDMIFSFVDTKIATIGVDFVLLR